MRGSRCKLHASLVRGAKGVKTARVVSAKYCDVGSQRTSRALMLPSLLEVGVLPMLWHQAQLNGSGGVLWHNESILFCARGASHYLTRWNETLEHGILINSIYYLAETIKTACSKIENDLI